MKIAIIGPGAMGCMFAAYLKQGGLDVTLVDHRAERAAELAANGIGVRGVRGDHQVSVPITIDAADLGPSDLVMVCVKAFRSEQALLQHRALVGKHTAVWSVQNGIGNLEAMAKVVPEQNLVGGSTTLGANLLGSGRVHHAGDGQTSMGELDGSRSERVQRLARSLSEAGIEVTLSDNIQQMIWSKLLVNVGINALTALLWVRNGVLVEHAPALAIMREAVQEAITVAKAEGYVFDPDAIHARVEAVARLTGNNRSSMLADMQAGRKTEIDYINGAIASRGTAPVNQTLTHLIHAMEVTANQRQLDAR